jgi:NADH-quinone oxidoreductase subunit G
MPDGASQGDLVTLTIDGIEVTVPKGTNIVEAAKSVGIEIPIYCYYHRLDAVGACRICLVEISPGPPKPQTACTTPVAQGMVVKTRSKLAVESREDIFAFLLANHPLDCPICDKGGECPLQDFSYRHGRGTSDMIDPKYHFVKPVPISPKIYLDRERCILCYRCTRYYDEIAWEQELTVRNRGVHSYIATQFDKPLKSIFSGNIIDICPVGALTSREWRFQSRPWDMESTVSICHKCAVGCNVTLWQRRGKLIRITSAENPEVDEGWICDRVRFNYSYVNSEERVLVPYVKYDGKLTETDWEDALIKTADLIIKNSGSIAYVLNAFITNEDAYVLRQFISSFTPDATVIMENKSTLPIVPYNQRQLKLAEIPTLDNLLVIASNTYNEAPILNLWIKKAFKKGVNVIVAYPDELDLDRRIKNHIYYQRGQASKFVDSLADEIENGSSDLLKLNGNSLGVVFGDDLSNENGFELMASVQKLTDRLTAKGFDVKIMPVYRATNERGFHLTGLSANEATFSSLSSQKPSVVVCLGELPQGLSKNLTDSRIILLDLFTRENLINADIVLPIPTFAETDGSITNIEGRVQFLGPVLPIPDSALEVWDILCKLSYLLGKPLPYTSIPDVQKNASQLSGLEALATPPKRQPQVRVSAAAARP